MPVARPSLVTGPLGFVGRWLLPELLREGPVVGVGLAPSERPAPRLGPFTLAGPDPHCEGGLVYRGEPGAWTFMPIALADEEGLRRALDGCRPAAVYHLAAQSSAARSFTDPVGTIRTNVDGLQNLLEAVRALPREEAPTVLAVGSCEEYGAQPPDRPLPEDTVLRPVSPYGVSKAAATLLALQYHRSYGLPVLATRSFSHSGPGQDPRFAFPSFASQIAAIERGKAEPVLKVGDLSPVRDFLDVRDVVRAYRLLVAEGRPGEVYNVCSGRALTIGEGLEILLREARREIRVEPDPARYRPVDIPYMVGDATRLRRQTGWRPERDFAASLGELLAWAREEQA